MKKFILVFLSVLFVAHPIWAQTKTTVTGTIVGTTGVPATSGYVEFRIRPSSGSVAYRVTGSVLIVPQTSRCDISSGGNVVAAGGAGACQVWGNSTITPANTSYDVIIAPAGRVTSTLNAQQISGTTYDLASPVFAPNVSLVPQYQNITVSPLNSNLIPGGNGVFNLGAADRYYGAGYFENLYANNLNVPLESLTLGNLNNRIYCGTTGTVGAAIQAALELLPSSGGIVDCSNREGSNSITSTITMDRPARVIFGAGTYTFTGTGPILVPYTGSIIEGQGQGVTILKAGNNNSDGLEGAGSALIQNLTLRGNTTPTPGTSGVDGCACDQLILFNVEIDSWGGHGVNTGGTSARWIILNSYIHDNNDDGILLANSAVAALVEGNTIKDNGSNGVDAGGHPHARIINNWIEGNGHVYAPTLDCYGVLVTSILSGTGDGVIVEGNTILDNYCQQITIRADSSGHVDYVQVKNNLISGANHGTIGINIDTSVGAMCGSVKYIQITKNIIHHMAGDAIQFGGGAVAPCVVTAPIVEGNTVVLNTGWGIRDVVSVGGRFTQNVLLSNVAGNITVSSATRALDFCNQTDTSVNLCALGNGTLAVNTIQPYSSVQTTLTSTGNTAFGITSTGVGRQPYALVLDQFGSLNFFDVTAALVRMFINSAGETHVKGPLNVESGEVVLGGTAFASLGTPGDGTFKYCTNCTRANPCASGGDGAWAQRLGGVWKCD